MAQSTVRPPRVKPTRSCRLSEGSADSPRRILSLFAGKEAFLYWLEAVPADFGQGYRLEKFTGGEVYHVNLGGGPRNSNTCECLGHLAHGHKTTCKHIAALTALKAAGRL